MFRLSVLKPEPCARNPTSRTFPFLNELSCHFSADGDLVVDCVDGGGCIEWMRRTTVMSGSNDPMAAVRRYVDAFNNADAQGMAAACADPMQILDGMSPHVWQGSTAAEDWWRDVLAEGEHLGASGYHITLASHGMLISPATTGMSLFPRP